MPLSEDETALATRVTRGSLRRLGSVEKDSTVSNPSTPVKGLKKMNVIPEDSLSDKPLPSPKLLRTRKSTVDSPMDSNLNATEKSTDIDDAKLITPAKLINKSIALTKENISKLNTSVDTPTRRMTRRSSVSESIESNSTVPKHTRMTRRASLTMEENEGTTNLKNSRMVNINEPLLEEKEENLDSSTDSSKRRITRSITNSPSLISGTSDLKDFKVIVNKMKSPEVNKSLANIEEKNVVFADNESVNDNNSSKPKYAKTPGSVNKRISIIEIEDTIVGKNLNFSSTTEDENNESVKDQSGKSKDSLTGDDSLSVLVENIKSNINDHINSPSILGTPKTSQIHNYKTPFKNIKENPQQFQSTPIPISRNDINNKNIDLKSPGSSKKSDNKVSEKSPKTEGYSKSWVQPIVSKNNSPKNFIDAFGINKSQDNKKDNTTISSSPNQSKNKTNEKMVIDEEEDSYDSSESENELFEAEAEEVLNYNSGDSRTGEDIENEGINNEVGAHDVIELGSDDSDSSLEEEESENESFIVEDEEESLLSANSEEHLESNDEKPSKNRKRIIINEDSTDDEIGVKKNNRKNIISDDSSSNENSSAKSKSLINETVAESDEEVAADTSVNKSKKIDKTITPKQSPVKELKSSSLKRKSVNEDQNIVGTPKSTSKNNISNLENDMLGKDSPIKSRKSTPLRSSLGGEILVTEKNNDTLSKNTPTKLAKNTPLRGKSDEIDESTKKMKTPTPRKSLLKFDIQSTEKSNKKTRTSILENDSAEENFNDIIASETPNKNTSIKPTESPKKSAKKNQSMQIEYEAMEVDEDDEEMEDIVEANETIPTTNADEANESIKTPKRKSKLIRIDGSIEIEKPKIKSTPPKEVDLDNILEKCNEIIKQKKDLVDKSREQYKAKQAMKKQKKLERKEKRAAEAMAASEDAGNILPIKKKKKQKLGRQYNQDVDDVVNKTAEIAEAVKVKKTLLEERLQKKKLKKQAKLLALELQKKSDINGVKQKSLEKGQKKAKENANTMREKSEEEPSEKEIKSKRIMSVAEAYAMSEHKKPEVEKHHKRGKKIVAGIQEKDTNNNKENTLISVGIKYDTMKNNGNADDIHKVVIEKVASGNDPSITTTDDVQAAKKQKMSEVNVDKKKKTLKILDAEGAPVKFVEQTSSPKRTASGFVELPLTPVSKPKKTRFGFIEQPVTPEDKLLKRNSGFKEEPVTPKTIGFKVSSVLPADRDFFTKTNKDKKNKSAKIQHIAEPITQLPKPIFKTSAGNFIIEKLPKKVVKPSVEGSTTDFTVTTISAALKSTNNNPLDFKKKALFANNARREAPKEMLAKELKRKANTKV